MTQDEKYIVCYLFLESVINLWRVINTKVNKIIPSNTLSSCEKIAGMSSVTLNCVQNEK